MKGFKFKVSGFRFQVIAKLETLNLELETMLIGVKGFKFKVSGFRFQVIAKLETLNLELETMLIGIVAVDQNLAIGKGGKLPWHYSTDMKFFKETTIGNAVVMGRRTWLTLKGPLPDRQNIVLTGDQNLAAEEMPIVMSDVESVLDFARQQEGHVFVIGGAKVYESFLPHIQRWIVTVVPLTVEGADTFMPSNFLDGFELYEIRQLDEGLRVKLYERKLQYRER